MTKDLTLAVKVRGDASELTTALDRAESDLQDLGKVARSIKVLENAVADVNRFEGELQGAQAKVRALQTALSEAYAADADAPLLRKLNSELANAERAASKAEAALTKSQAAVVKLNLEAGKTGVSTGTLAQKHSELAAETGKATARLDELKTKLTATEAAEKNLAAGATAVNAAFATLNIRSADKIQADINAVNQSLVKLASNAKVSGADFDRAYAGAQTRLAALRAELSGTETAAGKTSTMVTGLGASLRSLAAPIAGAAMAQEFIKANVGAESLERTLVQLTGSGEAAAAEIDYLKSTANRLGLSVQDASRAYISLTAAAKGTQLEGAGTRQVFEAVAGSMAKLGKSSADTEGALAAVSQMMSKGVISMEEWRQQLGERIPGAAQATADSLGITVGELNSMIESGQVLASDLLPHLAAGLEKTFATAGQAEGSVAAWNRLKNAIAETFTFIGNSGVWTALVTLLGGVATAAQGLTGAFELLGRIIGINFGALATFDFSRPIESIKNWKVAVTEAANDIQARMDKAKAATEGNSAAQQQLGTSAQAAGAAAKESGLSWLGVVNAYAKVGTAAKENVEIAVKSAAARAEEGKAAVALAQAFGSESEKRAAALDAAKNDAEALRVVADARRIEAEVIRSNLAALKEAAGQEASWTEEKRKQIAALERSVEVKTAESEQAAAGSLAAQQRAAALATETAMIQDNSARIDELRAAHEAAAVALQNTKAAREAGNASLADEQKAAIAAGQAAALYRDALSDQTKAIEYNAKVKQSETDLQAAGIRLAIEQARTMAQVAKAYGDEGAAASYLLEVKRLEIELAELTAQAKRAEGQAALTLVAAKRAELAASGQLTAAKEAELKAQELAAQVKLKEAEIATETAGRLRQLADATYYAADSADGASGSYQNLPGSHDGVRDSAEQAKKALDKVNSTSTPNNNLSWLNDPAVKNRGFTIDFAAEAYKKGATIEEVRVMQEYVNDIYAAKHAVKGGPSSSSTAAAYINGLITESVDSALKVARKEIQTGQSARADNAPSLGEYNQKATATAGGGGFAFAGNEYLASIGLGDGFHVAKTPINNRQTSTTVNINLNGRSTSVKVASADDANSLAAILKQLETDASRTY